MAAPAAPAPLSNPGSGQPSNPPVSLDLGTLSPPDSAHSAAPVAPPAAPSGQGVSLDLSSPTPPTTAQPTPSVTPPPQPVRPAPATPASVPPGPATAPTGAPNLGFIKRRPPRRAIADLQRTGNPNLDFSADPVRGTGTSVLRRQGPVPVLTGRTVLSDDRPKVLIGGEQAAGGSMQFTLTWSTTPPDARAAAAGLRRSTDLHLGCLWEMNDHTSGLMQSYQGGADSAIADGQTVLRLGGRSETEGQTLVAAVKHLSLLKRMVVFVYADSGHPEWDPLSFNLAVTLRGGVLIEIRPGLAPDGTTICAIASLHRVGGTLVLRREAEFLHGQQQAVGNAFGFDLPWAGDRSVIAPRLR